MPRDLSNWASRQRSEWQGGRLAPERAEALEQLDGWSWEPRAARRPRRHDGDGDGGALVAPTYPACPSAGRALLISVGRRREAGGAQELENAREALRSLGYGVTTVENPTGSELGAALVAHRSRPGWELQGSSVVAIMAHGSGLGQVECEDGGQASLRELFGMLTPSAAPSLAGKPKIWLVQSCRTGEQSRVATAAAEAAAVRRGAVETDGVGRAGRGRGSKSTAKQGGAEGATAALSEEVDHLWAFATSPGSVAYRGAMFSALREVVERHGAQTSWLELLQHANALLAEWSGVRLEGGVAVSAPLPPMEICSSCRGAAFSPADLVLEEASGAEAADNETGA